MTTSIGISVMVFAGLVLARAVIGKKKGRGTRIIAATLMMLILLFLAWMLMMVLVVGPSMRGMAQ